jgi:hypothetical protein
MEQILRVRGALKLTVKDASTGEILQVNEGDNLVLNTGLESLCHMLVGDITVPADVISNNKLNSSKKALTHVPLYGQFGVNSNAPSATDTSPFFNGTLDSNAVTPYGASDIIKAKYFYPSQNSVTIQFLLPPNKGNGEGGPDGITYREAVLMCKVSDSPIQYKWFARRVFGGIVKTSGTLIEAEWTFSLTAG